MNEPDPVNLHRVGGHLALDLANTISWRGTEREVDHLATFEALHLWALHSGVIRPDVAERLRTSRPDARTQGLSAVHALRRAIMGCGAALAAGARPTPKDLATIVAAAREALSGARLNAEPGANLRLAFEGHSVQEMVLGPIAWAAFDLFRTGPINRLRCCPPSDCGWLFLDTTKNGTRRWCSMETCGTRAKNQRRAHRP
jgi:predicted RNA-binding Zn ribbon-like protein